MPAATDAAMLLYYALDESQPKATRSNLGYLGSAQDLSVVQSSGTDGIPTVSDGNGGRALDIFVTRTGYTTAERALRGAQAVGSAHTARPTTPSASAANDFAFGCRFQWAAANTGGGATETEVLFGLGSVGTASFGWGLGVVPNSASAPTAAQLRLFAYGSSAVVDAISWTTGGGPATNYINPNEWYRVVVRIYYSGTGAIAKVYVVRESTGDVFTFTKNADLSLSNEAAFNALTDVAVHVSYLAISSSFPLYGGYVDESWLYDSPVSDSEATSIVSGGFTIPWDPPSYRRADHDVYVSCARDGATFPRPRRLALGTLYGRTVQDVANERVRFHVEGWRPGRPWLLRSIEGVYDTDGPWSSKPGNRLPEYDVNLGLWRMGGQLPRGAWEDVRNVETTQAGPRRRRGYRVRRNVSTAQGTSSANRFFFFRANSGSLYGFYKVGTNLYEETGAGATSLESGWNSQQLPVAFAFDNRAIILSGARRRTWRGNSGSTDSLGAAAPASISPAAGSGGTLNGAYYYAATLYDPTTGDETGPVVSAIVNPSTQKVTLTLPATAPESRYTKYRIYRTTNGGSPPNLFRILEVTVAATVDDTGEVDGTILLGQVTDSGGTLLAYLTGAAPDTFSFGCSHKERVFYGGGATYPDRVYVSEAQEPARWYSSYYLVCEGPVRALASFGHRFVAFTDNTVEIFESDWARDLDGNVSVTRTVISYEVGCVGPHAVVEAEGSLWWMDRRGVWRMDSGKPEPASGPIRDLFPYVNHSIASRAVLSYNHVRRQLWLSVAHASLQRDTDRFDTVLVYDLEAHAQGAQKWTIYERECSYHGKFDDDLNGLQFGEIDHLGVFKMAESYEGDGAQGSESYTTEDEGGSSGSVGISSISGSVVTVFGTPGWTSGALRGFSVVFRDRSTGALSWHLIADNTTTTLTVIGTPDSALAARDGYYIGGIRAYVRTAEQALNSPNRKIQRQQGYAFAALSSALYL